MRQSASSHPAPRYFRGHWLVAGDPGFDEGSELWNLMFAGRRPQVVARCVGPVDVVAALAYARAHDLEVSVRCTGYSIAGYSVCSGLVIDLSLMRGMRVDPVERTAWVQGGMKGGEMQIEAGHFGLGAATGGLSQTGIGTILAGGVGRLPSLFGLASDSILEAEVVTADGRIVIASAEDNPELLWALRGTAGNFGVVTAVKLRLHDVPQTLPAGVLTFPDHRIPEVLQFLCDASSWRPDELSIFGTLTVGSAAPVENEPVIELWTCHAGRDDRAAADLDRLRALGPVLDDVKPTGWVELHYAQDDEFGPQRYACDSEETLEMPAEMISALADSLREIAADPRTGFPFIEFTVVHGAMRRSPENPGAVTGSMLGQFEISPAAFWDAAEDDDHYMQWIESTLEPVRNAGLTIGTALPTMVSIPPNRERVARIYGASYKRLQQLKREWDPDNLFHNNLNILAE